MENSIELEEMLCRELMKQVEKPESLSEMEQATREMLQEMGRRALECWLEEIGKKEETGRIESESGQKAKYVFRREAGLYTLFGRVKYKRAYYQYEEQEGGVYPLDEELGLRPNAMSAGVERLSGLVGVHMAFEKGSQVFEELTLVKLSDQSLDKATQAYGKERERQEEEWKEQATVPEAYLQSVREGRKPLRLYGSIDGTSVHIRGEEGDKWRELKIGAWYEAKGKPPKKPDGKWKIVAENVSYYADISEAKDFSPLVWASGFQRQAHLARELIFIADGARWIWDIVTEHFPDAVQIVDWFHACQYLTPIAHVAFVDRNKGKKWVEAVKTDLWNGDLEAVIEACSEHVRPHLKSDEDPAQKAATFFSNNRQRMDYPTYRANGYHIGSGTIESAAKQIGAQRLKLAGARWNLDSARYISKARATFLSAQWSDVAARRTHLSRAA